MAIIKEANGLEYMDNVKFTAKMSEATNCLCDACHIGGRVIIISSPKTLYYNPKQGLSTR